MQMIGCIKLNKKIIVLLCTFLLSGCDSSVLWENDNFAIYWIDHPDNIELGRKVSGGYLGMGRPPFSLGGNSRYFVLKRKDHYFYYDTTVRDTNNQSLFLKFGPLTEQEFLEAKKAHSLPDFDVSF